jgi:isoprenylcysteine carboxyl methyltransferase (ICMT) family protein YpbQ
MSPVLIAFFAVAALFRLGTLVVSSRHEARLRAAGAVEYGAGNSRLIAAIHTGYYVAAFAEGWWRDASLDGLAWAGLTLYGFAILALLCVMRELGELWTVKVLIASDHTLKQGWLFRSVRHPNYFLNLIPELVGLSLAMKAWLVLAVLLPIYLAALFRRIRIEEAAMSQRFPEYPGSGPALKGNQ